MQIFVLLAAPLFALGSVGCDRPASSVVPTPRHASQDAAAEEQYITRMAVHGGNYSIDVTYPMLSAECEPLMRALRIYAGSAKGAFLADVTNNGNQPEEEKWQMRLAFELRAQTADFVSVLATGDAFSGGAHGNPLLASFVLHRPSARVLALPELFVNADAGLRVFADEARRVLGERQRVAGDGDERRIDDGTAPKAENYGVFLVDADGGGKAKGVIVIFPAYQVAAYAQGPQQVEVPAALFRDLLKPEFKRAFAATAAK